MKISCPGCQTMFALADERVGPHGLSIKCPKCKQPFSVQHPRPGDEGKVVNGVPLSATGQMRVAVHDTVVEQRGVGGAHDTLIDVPPNLEVKKGSAS